MRRLGIGLVYELFGTYARRPEDPADWEAEYEPEATLLALEGAVRRLGHRPVRIGPPHELLARVGKTQGAAPLRGAAPAPGGVDAVLSVAEGYGSRNRESWAPALLEMLGIPAFGSDAATLAVSLDKPWAKALVAAAGVPTAPHAVFGSVEEAERAPLGFDFPAFVKPRWEGTAKGIHARSRVEDRSGLLAEVARVVRDYRQPALVEAFLEGPEYTVTLVGNAPPRALPVLQRALDARTRIGLHALERRGAPVPRQLLEPCVPGTLEPALEAALAALALRAFEALECRDFARADFKLDAAGRPVFLEMNPLPTFAPEGSFGILAEIAGVPLEGLLAEVLAEGLRRLGLS